MTIGEQIQKLRISRGLTQERLAELLEVSRQSISKWELGQEVGKVTEILQAHPAYYYFHLLDPDNNVIEVTGSYHKGGS